MKIKEIHLNLTPLEFEALEAYLDRHAATGETQSLSDIWQKVKAIRSRLDTARRLLEKFPHREA